VKVFNSSVEIRVEKSRAMIEIARRNRSLLLFAQVRVQALKLCRLHRDTKIPEWKTIAAKRNC
jgi:hypothetical protein